ncbi:MAG: 4,5-DOPA dioxygenase extradiol [Chitinophagales bacterium]|nr:4,5-DOPA dioxygenase extradiol [Chitinophagales bacterium]
MDRISFIKHLAFLPLGMKLKSLSELFSSAEETKKMPLLFLGHGSPMNAIEENEFVSSFRKLGTELPRPRAILCISAHWETKGSFVTAMTKPRTIHDFSGFPKELFAVQYAAPGSPELAQLTKNLITTTNIGLDHEWGLDHGTWSVVKHLYPNADIPIIQMSLDYTKGAAYHYELGSELQKLRSKGVLIIGSGNMVHNLRLLAWDKFSQDNYAYDWALEANSKMKEWINLGQHDKLIDFKSQGKAFDLSIPSPEHYLPLIYILSLMDKKDEFSFFNDKYVAGSLSMSSLKVISRA